MRAGVRVGIDVGAVRIGVAASDPEGMLASPVETVKRGRGDLERIAAIATERAAIEVVVGLPRTLRGEIGPSASYVRQFVSPLSRILAPVPVRLLDERLSTADAHRRLQETGVRGRRVRAVVDQEAAVVILQSALDIERGTGRPPGQVVEAAE
jgi:putative holliday junction resolvase